VFADGRVTDARPGVFLVR